MSDIALLWDSASFSADFAVENNDFEIDDGLQTAVLLSLFVDRRAEPGDTLPDGETDRRGWWADAHPAVEGDKIGSRLWLLNRSKRTADVLPKAEEYAREALAWLLDDSVASAIAVTASWLKGSTPGFELAITIERPTGDAAKYRFNKTWAAEDSRS